jgi:hypothetical protein
MEDKNKRMDPDRLIAALRSKEPVLKDPEELTGNIMEAILKKIEIRTAPVIPVEKSNRQLTIILRLLAAASVCLFLIFGYEQYVVVDKIGKLEIQNASISQNKKYGAAVKINQVVALLKSDPKVLAYFKKTGAEKPDKLNLLKAAILFDILTIAGNDTTHQNFIK